VEFKDMKKIDLISVEENVSMQMDKKYPAIEVKEMVDGRNCSLQHQVLPKDKTKNINDLQQSSDRSGSTWTL
jgi:hypothetical protein